MPSARLRWSPRPPAQPDTHLLKSEIHIWSATLDDFREDLPRFRAVLSADERTRAGRFDSDGERDSFVIRRALLRELLGRYLDRRASGIELSYGRRGKPYVSDATGGRPLEFTVSRSAALAVYALTATGPIGVDVERIQMMRGLEAVAARVLAAPDLDRLMALPPGERARGFLARWTCKEAVLKATGDGLAQRLTSLTTVESHAASEWQLQQLWPAPGYVGALAHTGDCTRLSMWALSPAVLAGSCS